MNIYIGSGGLFRDIAAFLCLKNTFLVDDNKIGTFEGYSIVGTVDEFIKQYHAMIVKPNVFNSIGSDRDNRIRNQMYEKLQKAGIKTRPLILASFVSKNVTIGDNVLIGIGAQIHHDCVIKESVVISPGAIVLGGVTIKNNAFIGAGAVIKQDLTIGKNSVIGMCSCVLNNIGDNEIWAGNPARFIKGAE